MYWISSGQLLFLETAILKNLKNFQEIFSRVGLFYITGWEQELIRKDSITGVFLKFYHKPKRSSCFRLFYPDNIYLFKVNNRNTRKRCEICSELTIKTPERRQWRRFAVFIFNFEHNSQLFLEFLLLTLNK